MRLIVLLLLILPLPAHAFERVTTRDAFLALVEGRQLVGNGVALTVGRDGTLTGTGLSLALTGAWEWAEGLFCRTLEAPDRTFPRDCQTVERQGDVLRFGAEAGAGATADLRLR